MATTRSLVKGAAAQGKYAAGENLLGFIENILDQTVQNQTATDINHVFAVSPGDYVILVGLQVLVKAGATSVVDVGDTTHNDGYLDSADLNTGTPPVYYAGGGPYTIGSGSVITGLTSNQLYGLQGGKLYTANGFIDAVFDNTDAASKFRCTALILATAGNLSTV